MIILQNWENYFHNNHIPQIPCITIPSHEQILTAASLNPSIIIHLPQIPKGPLMPPSGKTYSFPSLSLLGLNSFRLELLRLRSANSQMASLCDLPCQASTLAICPWGITMPQTRAQWALLPLAWQGEWLYQAS